MIETLSLKKKKGKFDERITWFKINERDNINQRKLIISIRILRCREE